MAPGPHLSLYLPFFAQVMGRVAATCQHSAPLLNHIPSNPPKPP